ncbi:mCG147396 [Mus musculus]|nr:mCG147396 [Mus musculus]
MRPPVQPRAEGEAGVVFQCVCLSFCSTCGQSRSLRPLVAEGRELLCLRVSRVGIALVPQPTGLPCHRGGTRGLEQEPRASG